jgi:hypothetical protein
MCCKKHLGVELYSESLACVVHHAKAMPSAGMQLATPNGQFPVYYLQSIQKKAI